MDKFTQCNLREKGTCLFGLALSLFLTPPLGATVYPTLTDPLTTHCIQNLLVMTAAGNREAIAAAQDQLAVHRTQVSQHHLEIVAPTLADRLKGIESRLGKFYSSGKLESLMQETLHDLPALDQVFALTRTQNDEMQLDYHADKMAQQVYHWLGANPRSIAARQKAHELGYTDGTFAQYLDVVQQLEQMDLKSYFKNKLRTGDSDYILKLAGIKKGSKVYENGLSLIEDLKTSHLMHEKANGADSEFMERVMGQPIIGEFLKSAFKKAGVHNAADQIHFLRHPEKFPSSIRDAMMNEMTRQLNSAFEGETPWFFSSLPLAKKLGFSARTWDEFQRFASQSMHDVVRNHITKVHGQALEGATGLKIGSAQMAEAVQKATELELSDGSYPLLVALRSGILHRAIREEMLQLGYRGNDIENGFRLLQAANPEEMDGIADRAVARVIHAHAAETIRHDRKAIDENWGQLREDNYRELREAARGLLVTAPASLATSVRAFKGDLTKPLRWRPLGEQGAERAIGNMILGTLAATSIATGYGFAEINTHDMIDAPTWFYAEAAVAGGIFGFVPGAMLSHIPVLVFKNPYDKFNDRGLAFSRLPVPRLSRLRLLSDGELHNSPYESVRDFLRHAENNPIRFETPIAETTEDVLLRRAAEIEESTSTPPTLLQTDRVSE